MAPAIGVVKIASPTSVSEGGAGSQAVTYTYAVTNTSPAAGVDPLSGVTLADTDGTPTLVSNGDGDALLEAGETWIYTLTVTLPPQDAGTSHTNTATATGTDDEGNTATATATATVTYTDAAPAIGVVKTASPTSVSEGGVGNQAVTYTYAVTNTSPAGAVRPAVGGDAGRHRRHADLRRRRHQQRHPARGGRDVDLHADRDACRRRTPAPATPTRPRPPAPTTRATRPPPPPRRR